MASPYETLSVVVAPPGASPSNTALNIVITDMLSTDTIQHLKRLLAREMRRPADWSLLTLYFGHLLEDERTLEHYGIRDGDRIILASPLSSQQIPPNSARRLSTMANSARSLSMRANSARGLSTMAANPGSRTDDVEARKRPDVAGRVINNLHFKDTNGKTFLLNNVPVGLSFDQLKDILREEKGLDLDFCRLLYAGKQLQEGTYRRRSMDGKESLTDLARRHFPRDVRSEGGKYP